MAASSSTEVPTSNYLLALFFHAFLEHGRTELQQYIVKDAGPATSSLSTKTPSSFTLLKSFLNPSAALSSDTVIGSYLQKSFALKAWLETQPENPFNLCLIQIFDFLDNQDKERLLDILKIYLMEHARLSEKIKQKAALLIKEALDSRSFLANATFVLKMDSVSSLELVEKLEKPFGDKGAILIGKALRTNANITSLYLRHNNVGVAGARFIANALRANSTLTTLDLWNNNIGAEGAALIADALRTNSTLTFLLLTGNKIGIAGARLIADALKTNSTLTSLYLSHNRIGDEGTSLIADVLETNSTLNSLDLACNKINDEGAKPIANALRTNSTLTSLNLDINNIGDEGARLIADALKTNSTLTSLNLSYNKIGDEGARLIADALRANSTLTSLNLKGNTFSNKGARLIADALKTNSTLTSLDLRSDNLRVMNEGLIEQLMQIDPILTSLDLEDNQVSPAIRQQIIILLDKNKKDSDNIHREVEILLERNRNNNEQKKFTLLSGLWTMVNKPDVPGGKSLVDSVLENPVVCEETNNTACSSSKISAREVRFNR